MAKKKNKIVENIEFIFLVFAINFVKYLPLSIAKFTGNIIGIIIYIIGSKHRKRSISHLLHAKVAKDENEAISITKQCFKNLLKTFIEICKSSDFINKENLSKHVKITASEKTKKLFLNKENKQNAICVSAHYGNWEISGPAYTLLSNTPLRSVMRPLNNEKFGEWIRKNRTTDKHTLCDKKNAVRALLKSVKKKESIGIIADQHAGTADGIESLFFGEPVRAHTSPATMHLKTKLPLIVFVLRRLDDDFHFEFDCSDPIIYEATGDKEADVKAIVDLYLKEIEKMIKKDPSQWLWMHRRWLNINRKRR